MAIQPGPALSRASHQDASEVRPSRGRNRRKSTCSPIWATSAKTTDAALPNSSRSRPPAGSPCRPEKRVHCAKALLSFQAIAAKGSRLSRIQNGWVSSWKRLISVMPWVTSGMMATALTK